ncbi:hypothetical protein B5M42_008195 [Paenibacillus athensensis]|uniref:Lipoprotein n=1 Tax=Paenibacillus athensensis TaxID=1967502 RepID=A0A4Y8PVZ0_9BACL|nr:hypothetical protein [Paenibacillus athensensis]MCD1258814.1 hypothetical protein [Paenibacillus athensensis]
MRKYTLMIFVLMLLLAGCEDELKVSRETVSPSPSPTNQYEEYQKLYNKMVDSLQIPDFKKIEDNKEFPYLIQIDKSVSFDKREYMSVTGDATNQPTQNRIVYSSNDGNYTLYMDLIYLTKDIGNDMVYSDVVSKSTLNNENAQRFRQDILSYKNNLVRITLFSNKDQAVSIEIHNRIDRAIVDFLKKE